MGKSLAPLWLLFVFVLGIDCYNADYASYGGKNSKGNTVTTHMSVSEVIGQEATECLFGLLLIVIAFPVLYFNELRQVHMDKILDFAEASIVDVSADTVNNDNQACPVCVRGETRTDQTLTDPDLGVRVSNCAKLSRDVQMYQWNEHENTTTKDNSDGTKSSTKTYTYQKGWFSHGINSDRFDDQSKRNPPMPLNGQVWKASSVSLGAFQLDGQLIDQMTNFQPTEVREQEICGKVLKRKSADISCIESDGNDDDHIGALRVKMRKVSCGPASVASLQSWNSFQPLTYEMVPSSKCCCFRRRRQVDLNAQAHDDGLKFNGPLSCICSCIGFLIRGGECLHNLEEYHTTGKNIIRGMRSRQKCLHFCLRILSWCLFVYGLYDIFKLSAAPLRIIPWIGIFLQNITQYIALGAAFLIGSFLWCITMAISWLYVKPIRGIFFLAMACAIIIVPGLSADQLKDFQMQLLAFCKQLLAFCQEKVR